MSEHVRCTAAGLLVGAAVVAGSVLGHELGARAGGCVLRAWSELADRVVEKFVIIT